MFVVGEKKAAIVECAVSGAVANFKEQWPDVAPQPTVTHLVAMHAHFDHICGIPTLQELFPTALVTTNAAAARVMGKAKVMAGFFEQDRAMVDVLLQEGILAKAVDVPESGTIVTQMVLADEDVLKIEPGCSLKTIAAPGHSPCSMAMYMPEDKVLFMSDVTGFQISDEEIFPIFFQGYEMYIDSILRVQGYPARLLALPHETIWSGSDIPAFYERALKAARQAFATIRDMSETGLAPEEMARTLFDHYYRGDLQIYTPENINLCVNLLIKRVQECL